jgi:predicted small lipoprotein YifL
MRTPVALLAFALLLTACGQKGDLYIPSEREVVATVPTGATPPATPASPEDEEEDRQLVQPPPQ